MRLCDECGYSWPMPGREPARGRLTEGIELTPHLQSAAHLIGEQVMNGAEQDVEVRQALGHCPQCGYGPFTEYRAEEG